MEILDKFYYLNVGKGSTFEKSGDHHTEPAGVAALVKYLEAKDTDRLLGHESKILVPQEAEEDPNFEMPQETEGNSRGLFEIIAVVGKIPFALKRYHKPTHHDFYPTIIEETFRVIYLDKNRAMGPVGHEGQSSEYDCRQQRAPRP